MSLMKPACRIGLPLILLHGLSACTWLNETFPDKSQDYKRAEPTRSLEVPPDLTSTSTTDLLVVPSGSTTLSGYESARESFGKQQAGTALPDQDSLKFMRKQDLAWLVVQGEPGTVWPSAREFWIENGFFIMQEDPALGTLETDWAENRAAIPQDPIRRLIGRVYENAYTSAYRDRYRMRLEQGAKPGSTELFITHQGVEEIVSGESDDTQTTQWGPRPHDPGMESEMLKRMMVYLGVNPAKAEQEVAEAVPEPNRAELIQQDSGQATLVIKDDYDKAWRNVGIVLDRVGFAVEDRDRLQGIYYVRYNDPLKGQNKQGFMSKLAFWTSDDEQVERYQIKLSDDGADTRVVVLNEQGEAESSITGVRILNLLYDELR